MFDIEHQVVGFPTDNYGGMTGNTINGTGGYHEAILRNDGVYRIYWIAGVIDSDGTDLYITLDDIVFPVSFFVNGRTVNLSRGASDLNTYGFYYSDTIDYFENMLQSIN